MTLWDFEKVMRHSLTFALAEMRTCLAGEGAADMTVEKMVEIRDEVADELKGKGISLREIRLQAFRRTLQAVGSDDREFAARLNAVYRKHRYEDIELYPDVLATLDDLGLRYMLGLVSNGNSLPQQCGLEGRLAFVVFSEDVGFEKPDERIFEIACRQADCTPQEWMHVGDSLECDVEGARRVGAVSVWLNRDGRPRESNITPDYEISSLRELGELK